MFGADSDAYEAGQESAEEWVGREEAEQQGWLDGGWVAENSREEAVYLNLKELSDAGGEFAARLDVRRPCRPWRRVWLIHPVVSAPIRAPAPGAA